MLAWTAAASSVPGSATSSRSGDAETEEGVWNPATPATYEGVLAAELNRRAPHAFAALGATLLAQTVALPLAERALAGPGEGAVRETDLVLRTERPVATGEHVVALAVAFRLTLRAAATQRAVAVLPAHFVRGADHAIAALRGGDAHTVAQDLALRADALDFEVRGYVLAGPTASTGYPFPCNRHGTASLAHTVK